MEDERRMNISKMGVKLKKSGNEVSIFYVIICFYNYNFKLLVISTLNTYKMGKWYPYCRYGISLAGKGHLL